MHSQQNLNLSEIFSAQNDTVVTTNNLAEVDVAQVYSIPQKLYHNTHDCKKSGY
jgi:hypothetical protein